jgi:hypothetical protein
VDYHLLNVDLGSFAWAEVKAGGCHCCLSSCIAWTKQAYLLWMPLGFRIPGKVLKLKKTLYGLRQSPCAFWKYLVEKMAICGMVQSKLDPCLFVGEKVICISYVDDLIFLARNEKDIHHIAMKLREV